jgi:hypothetical protein
LPQLEILCPAFCRHTEGSEEAQKCKSENAHRILPLLVAPYTILMIIS